MHICGGVGILMESNCLGCVWLARGLGEGYVIHDEWANQTKEKKGLMLERE